MNNIKSVFSIKDLENISGIKAHTIRIWEKRYSLFEPDRINRNVRVYNYNSLLKILNIALLNKQGLKISKIAKLSDEEIILKTREHISKEFKDQKALSSIKLAMYTFDRVLFNKIYEEQMSLQTFSEVFQSVLGPFLIFMGLQWHSQGLNTAHEHFITNLIYQKIQLNTERIVQSTPQEGKPTYILYLPEEEMHEIGLLYLNYELILRGFKTIYLGRSVPLADLYSLNDQLQDLVWISHFTIAPPMEFIIPYLDQIKKELLSDGDKYWVVATQFHGINEQEPPKGFAFFKSLKEVVLKFQ
jgi:DNA-binding transcriptional MerR regulator